MHVHWNIPLISQISAGTPVIEVTMGKHGPISSLDDEALKRLNRL
jgi:hypothetical protein